VPKRNVNEKKNYFLSHAESTKGSTIPSSQDSEVMISQEWNEEEKYSSVSGGILNIESEILNVVQFFACRYQYPK
jgi:hypothetical protein